MRRYSHLIAVFMFLALAGAAPNPVYGELLLRPVDPREVGISPQRLEKLDAITLEHIEKKQFPGAVILVARKGGIVYRKAFGDRTVSPSRSPMEVDTIFDLASLTKIMPTAVAVMILVEEGRLALSDAVSKHLNRFSQYGKHRITVRQLLTHYSGLRPSLSLKAKWRGYEAAVARACREQLATRPGARFRYSDINYVVLGELVRVLSGDHLDAFSRKRVFEPLGMTDTFFNPRERMKSRIAPTERHEGKMLQGRVHDPTAARMGGCAGHAGAFSTADDVARFGQMILNGGVYDGRRILSPLGVLQMTTPQSPTGKPVLRGLGFDIHSRYHAPRGDLFPVGSFGHSGFTGTSLWIDPYTETLVVILTSRLHPNGRGDAVPFRKRVASIVGASIVDRVPVRAIRSTLWSGPSTSEPVKRTR
ncbi:MAG: serine hydrolase [Acidobacteriota bacterium]|nr:serine hydrolase [Acidobacteriota bacterium]